MSFPEIKFGICQRCGGDGRDQTEDLTDADAPARTLIGNGVELEKYDDKLLCNVCINELKADQESLEDQRKQAEEEKFRMKAGFLNSVT